ncbi:SDR family oxidoreductase [Chryseobacterium joostei]|uniref:NAD(P)-dependent dehydrogenase, short-chain alcohol dehydrogenase family n=1 Tax=Chryseobacterium joostei TaxID=112234 RepID=A0A1N7I3Q9_9FLAO|nr:SDR family oxidoreductase [Chryseobacterium sp.]AZA99823.1 SDR family oxidoreductase [Chryseobacterium joostei]SIS31697.1 NAD(P)-dependent dehydrogenase, short-chain alcohol dehydrogenase family [Chryseobacterium joostei]HCM33524.1 SDR family NAD(P)-dependent oxidoreductase [Chryseobacterium sp.]
MHKNFLDFSEKAILITGAGSGIGKATALYLSSINAKLLLLDINEDALKETLSLCNDQCDYLAIDLSDSHGIKIPVQDKIKTFGPLDGMVHIAGIPYLSPLKTLNTDTVDKVLKVNTVAALELAKIFTKHKNYKTENPSIVFISSVYGLVGSAANVAYAMSKSALHGITKSLAIELAPKHIRVNCIAPGFIKTQMLDDVSGSFDNEYNNRLNQLHPLGLGEAEDIAYGITYLLSDMGKWVTGTILSVDGGFTAQ